MPKRTNYDALHRVLDLKPGASLQEIEESWRLHVSAWHPDKFTAATEAQKRKATEKLQAINDARDALRAYRNADADNSSVAEEASPTSKPSSMRVGVIEVGSRAIRLLVADVSMMNSLTPVHTLARETHLMRSIQNGAGATRENLANIHHIIADFTEKASKLGASPIKVFGTEAIRKLKALSNDGAYPEPVGIDVLNEVDEALCSLISVVHSLDASLIQNRTLLAIDQGSGSVEVAVGRSGPPIEMVDFRSVPLGDGIAVEKFKNMSIPKFMEFVRHLIKKSDLPTATIDQVVIQGSAATKLAWLKVRGPRTDYDPRSVHGHLLKSLELRQLVSLIAKATAKQRAHLAEIVDPRRPGSGELDRVVAGSVVLLALLEHFRKEDFLVSSQGTRHGLAWRLATQVEEN